MAKIINFHDIYDRPWFEDTLSVIQELDAVVPCPEIEQLYHGKKTSEKSAHLTLDDGHISTYTLIYPALKKRGLTASIFVSPKIIQDQTNFWYFESGDYDKEKLRKCISEILQIESTKLNNLYPRAIMKNLTLDQNWKIIYYYRQ